MTFITVPVRYMIRVQNVITSRRLTEMKKELFRAFINGFGNVYLIGLQTYNLVNQNYLLAGFTSVLITICWIGGIHSVLKTRLHKVCYGIGAVSGVEMAILTHQWIF